MRRLTESFASSFLEKWSKGLKKKDRIEEVIYHSDTSSIAPQTSTHNICYSWRENLEEPSSKEIFPHVKIEKF
jgi:hypothetical protein